ncbi:hypothetical protein CMO93_04695 [Candidatus Woesearchaeota archaeon]|nr:hypothetical protein [Candidatus Woesearchaeota archaeon]|tara:strand:+ start:1445 stop:2047 length:603 start_codon:yes stop_codon:yes gene_type:complete
MIDFVIPNNNEKEFISIAEKLGYTGLYFLYNLEEYFEKNISGKIKIHKAILADARYINKTSNKYKDKDILIAIKSSSQDRNIMEGAKANIIFSFEEHTKRDFMHQRGSGLNHIMCKLMHENSIAVGFSLNSILNSEKKHLILGRIMQNIKLCRKYGVKMIIASFAEKPFEMRSPHDLASLFLKLGMGQKEVKESLDIMFK